MSQSTGLDPLLVTPLRRPEPRRGAPAAKARPALTAPRPAVLKAVAWLTGGAILVAFAGNILAFASQPFVAWYRSGEEVRLLQTRLVQQRQVNARLEADIAYLRTDAGVEQEARRRGWVRTGEVALSVDAPDLPDARPAPPDPARPKLAFADRVRGAIETCLAVFGGPPAGPQNAQAAAR